MSHEVYTAVKGELVQARLPLYSGTREVRAARIVAIGLAPVAGETRLALEGGAHVDVSKAWMQKNGAQAGQYYVQEPNGERAETIAADEFEASFTTISEGTSDTSSYTAAPAKLAQENANLRAANEEAHDLIDRQRELLAELQREDAKNPSAADLDTVATEQQAAVDTANNAAPTTDEPQEPQQAQ